MPVGFVASDVSAAKRNGLWIVALRAPSTDEEDFYLTFQNKETYTDQDIKFGWNQPYIEFCGQGWPWYGHMKRVELESDLIRVLMDNEAAERMQNDGILEIQFHITDLEFAQIQTAIQSIFRGVEYYHYNNGDGARH